MRYLVGALVPLGLIGTFTRPAADHRRGAMWDRRSVHREAADTMALIASFAIGWPRRWAAWVLVLVPMFGLLAALALSFLELQLLPCPEPSSCSTGWRRWWSAI